MTFFSDLRGRSYPIARIKWVDGRVQDDNGTPYVTALMDDDEHIKILHSDAKRITNPAVAFVPAETGTFLLGGIDPENPNLAAVWRTPVVAWAVKADGEMVPCTPDGENDGVDEPPEVLMPSGMVVSRYLQAWQSEGDWFKSELESVLARMQKEGSAT